VLGKSKVVTRVTTEIPSKVEYISGGNEK